MKLLVLGRDGQVARQLGLIGPEMGFTVTRLSRDEVWGDPATLVGERRPDLIVNAAAYTAVDKAESEPEAAFALNAELPGRFAKAARAAGAPFVHLSTDYVFDGTLGRPYREDDARGPINVYGRSKAAGEDAVLDAGGAVVRTAWVYEPEGANFVRTMLRLGREREEVSVVADQRGCPTFAGDAARAALLVGGLDDPGVVHAAGGGGATWAELAEAVFALSGMATRVKPIATADYPTAAARAADTRLDCAKLEALTGWRPPPWRARLAEVLPGFSG